MSQTTEVLCARCHVPIERIREPDSDDRGVCPKCGEGDTYDAIMSEVSEYVQEMATQKISEMIANSTKGSDVIKVTSTHIPSTRQWRFIAKLNL